MEWCLQCFCFYSFFLSDSFSYCSCSMFIDRNSAKRWSCWKLIYGCFILPAFCFSKCATDVEMRRMTALISTATSCRNEKSTNISRKINIKHHQVLLLFTNQDSGFQSDQCGVIVQHRTHKFRIRDSAGFTVPSTSVPSTSVWPNRELLSSSSLSRKKQSLKPLSLSEHLFKSAHCFLLLF